MNAEQSNESNKARRDLLLRQLWLVMRDIARTEPACDMSEEDICVWKATTEHSAIQDVLARAAAGSNPNHQESNDDHETQ